MTATHVLIVGERREMHQRLKQAGARLTLLIEVDQIRAGDNTFYERVIGLPARAQVEEWVALAHAVDRTDPIQAIGGFEDRMQDKAAAIAAALDLPFHTPEVIAATRFKDRMRNLLNKAGVDPTVNRRIKSAAEIETFAATYGYPLILKPVDGRASIGVSLIRSTDDIPAALRWFEESAYAFEMCIEQYLSGKEYSVEAFSEYGQHRIVCITEKFKETVHFVEVGHAVPALLGPATETAIEQLVRRTLTTLGVQHGPSHTEIMVTADGPRIVETHLRAGGDQIPQLIALAGGVDLLDLWVRQILGEQVWPLLSDHAGPDTYAAIWFAVPQALGTIERVDGLDQAKAIEGVDEVVLRLKSGARLGGLHDSFARAAYAIAAGPSQETALERAQAATKALRFLVLC